MLKITYLGYSLFYFGFEEHKLQTSFWYVLALTS